MKEVNWGIGENADGERHGFGREDRRQKDAERP